MKLRIVILSAACISCLVPPALGTGILAAKAIAAVGAAKGAAVLGAGALAVKGALVAKGAAALKGAALLAAKVAAVKGAALLAAKAAAAVKGAALLAVKGAAVKGAALLAAKTAAVKGAVALAAKGAVLGSAAVLGAKAVKTGALIATSHAFARPVLVPYPYAVPHQVPALTPVPVGAVRVPSLLSKLLGLWGIAQDSVQAKTHAVGELLAALQAHAIRPPVVYDYEIINSPRFYPAPIFEKVYFDS